jgi:hypothetical protein
MLLLLPARAFSQFCPGCIQNSSTPQVATFNLTKGATIQGLLDVGQLAVGNFSVTTMTATQFIGGGAGLTGLNASSLASGNVSSTVVSGPYPDITQVGALTAGQWNASPVPTQYGGTGQNFVDVSAGSLIYFSAAGQMSTFLPGQPQQLLQTNGSGAPVWVSSPAVSGANLYNIPAARLTGSLPTTVTVSSNSIPYVAGASVLGNISGAAGTITGTLPQSQVATGTWPTSYAASSITATGVTPATYGSGSYSPQLVVHVDGRIYSAAQLPITVGASSVTSGTFPPTVILPLSDLQPGTLPTSVPASSITATGVNPGTYGGSGFLAGLTIGVDGRVTSATQYAAPGLSTSTALTNMPQRWTAPQTFSATSSMTILSDLGVGGTITGNLTGNVTGNAYGSAGSVASSGVGAGSLGTGVKVSTANFLPGFNGANELVQLNGSGALPVLSGANLTNLPIGNKFGFLSATNQTLGVGTFSFGYTNAAVTISSMSVIVTTSGSGGSSGTVWACCYGGNCVSVTSSQGAAVGSSYTGNGAISVPMGGQIVLQMTSTGESYTPTVNAVCGYQ